MAYIVTDACVNCRYTDCVEVCPVDCFHGGNQMLVIDPGVCIDCGVCVLECPVSAIKSEAEAQDALVWLERAKKYSAMWPKITKREKPLDNAEKYKDETDKFMRYMSDL